MARLATTIEAILYLKAQALTLAEIAELACCDRDDAEEGLLELMADYAHRETALEVIETPNGYSLQLREDFQNLVQNLIPADIGKGALRTLAVIALKGPMIQTDLINLRGSTAYDHVRDLVEKGFVRKRRRSDGRSFWLQVTDKFHQYFQLNQLPGNIDQLLGESSSNTTKVQSASASKPEAAVESDEATETEAPTLADASDHNADGEVTDAEAHETATNESAPPAPPTVVGTISDEVLEREEQLYESELEADTITPDTVATAAT
ncbi:SMC-Scp complex subunit ScpB [filamentous cyanobacterium LEGE 11480]|uniref:SMC-Scp complex subunit ScpB n=1 Tax=Romeriopsis navalis LEGE 11480 TaxID=2777977 RepID=A0A928VHC6_9CYAN|nr:SMC-Scp complex subunit ScpB [Romeriopsis navalis]MBE9028350.1 SMC-Scp complex subunit ScpB [Romeriopsis navalis LEGE 11480]